MEPLESVRKNIFRAAFHHKCLQSELEGYFKTNPGHIVLEADSSLDSISFTIKPKKPMPARFGIIVGDCLQNLRSAMDYLVWELVLAAKNEPSDKNMFPICSTSERFKEQVCSRKRLMGVPPDAVTEIDRLQPHTLGQDRQKSILWAIDGLVNINKHRRIPLTMLKATRANFDLINIDGKLWTYGHFPVVDGNTKFGPCPVIHGQMQMDTQITAFVAFNEGAAKGMEISSCLNDWSFYILKDVLPRFEKFFV